VQIAQEIEGLWWFPKNPSTKHRGVLKISSDARPVLNLTIVESTLYDGLSLPQNEDLILGLDCYGNFLTLVYCSRSSRKLRGCFAYIRYHALTALKGIELDCPNFEVNKITFNVHHLAEWVGRKGLDFSFSDNSISAQYQCPGDLSYRVDDLLDVDLISCPSASNSYSDVSISEETKIRFRSSVGLAWVKCQELVRSIRLLLHFAILNPIYPTSFSASKAGNGKFVGGQFREQGIAIWTSLLRESVDPEVIDGRWVFKLNDLKEDFGVFLKRWFTFLNDFEEALLCYSTTVYHPVPDSVYHLCLRACLKKGII